MRNVLVPALVALLLVGCNEPNVQPFGPSELPVPDAPTPVPVLYQITATEVTSEPALPSNLIRFRVTLEVTNNENIVVGASVYLWVSSGTLSVSEHERSDPLGRVELTWEVPPNKRVVLSACGTQSGAPACEPRLVVLRHS